MQLIVAVDEAWGIGLENRLLFRIREDLKRFRQMTVGKTIIYGRRTLDTFPGAQPLAGRDNIVLTRDPLFKAEGVRVCRSAAELLEILRTIPKDEVFVVGGASVYRQLFQYCEFAHVTRVGGIFPADSFFPDLDASRDWRLIDPGTPMQDGALTYRWSVYQNVNLQEAHP
jgi:dihydrofolate reductase